MQEVGESRVKDLEHSHMSSTQSTTEVQIENRIVVVIPSGGTSIECCGQNRYSAGTSTRQPSAGASSLAGC
jgi:hypothetical protein